MESKHRKREIVIVLGRTGQGKSIWTRSFCRGFKRVFASDILQDFNASYVTANQLLELHDSQKLFNANFRIGTSDPDDLDLLGSMAFLYGRAWLVIEEAGFYFPAGSRAPAWMREAAFLGRHRELSILITAQRPTSIPTDLRSQASRVICFNQLEKNDINWLDTYFGELMDEIGELEELECLDATAKEVTRYKIDPSKDDLASNDPTDKRQGLLDIDKMDDIFMLKKQAD